MSKLIYCEKRSTYNKIDKSMLWNYYITDSLDDCLKYISLYFPKSITICEKKTADLPLIIEHINKEYHEFPSLFIFNEKHIIASITDELSKRNIIHADKIPLEIDNMINTIMLKYKFLPKLKGYTYIKRALYEGLLNDSAYINIKKILYPNIATMYLVSESAVERGITFSIEKAYRSSAEIRELFDNSERPPSNLHFLKRFFIALKDILSSQTNI